VIIVVIVWSLVLVVLLSRDANKVGNISKEDLQKEQNPTVRVTPEKRSNPRMFKVSTKLLEMLSILPKKSELVFGTYDMCGFRRPYTWQRKRIALKLGNPRLNQITFTPSATESNNGIPQDEGHPVRNASPRP